MQPLRGNGHTIANLFVQSEDALFTGLFGYTGYDTVTDSYSIIRRVGMIDVELSGYNYIGGLVGLERGRHPFQLRHRPDFGLVQPRGAGRVETGARSSPAMPRYACQAINSPLTTLEGW